MTTRKLYFGDNLEIMRDHVPDESVDLVYLDPPFNSNQAYNVLFKSDDSRPSQAQMEAFDDTWHWTPEAEAEWNRLVTGTDYFVPPALSQGIHALRQMLGENDVMAYLVMMTPRLLEIHRALKDTGSMYLHCDPTASHYLKIICDQIFGPQRFRNEIVWKRAATIKGNFGQGAAHFGRMTDSILFYSKGQNPKFRQPFRPMSEQAKQKNYRYTEEGTGRRYRLVSMTGPGGAAKGNPEYEVMGVTRFWRYSKESMEKLIADGLVVQTKPGNVPRRKYYLDESPGAAIQSLWDDVPALSARSSERLGYPTQKPLVLLERIIEASTNKGDVVLDPFCGCGTTVAAAEKLKRSWIGIDIAYLAVALIGQRLHDHYPRIKYEEFGSPRGLDGAKALFDASPKNFEMWAVRKAGGRPNPKGGGDKGTDGVILFLTDGKKQAGTVTVSVKGGETVNPAMVRDLIGTVEKDKTEMGVLITRVEPTKGMRETATKAGIYHWPAFGKDYPRIQIITVQELLDGKRPDMPIEHGTYTVAFRIRDEVVQMKLD